MDMQTGWNENRALLRGVAAAAPTLSHENHGVAYETFPLSVLRLSGSEDRVNVIAARPLLEQCPVAVGTPLEVEGEVRSFNNKSGRGSRLVITLYARSLRKGGGEPANDLVLAGVLCKPPVFRRTPLGRISSVKEKCSKNPHVNGLLLCIDPGHMFGKHENFV